MSNKLVSVFAIVIVALGAGLLVISRSLAPTVSPTKAPLATPDVFGYNTQSTDTPSQSTQSATASTKPMNNSKSLQKPTSLSIDPQKTYTATLKTTAGDIVIEFDTKNTPNTANNFIYLAKNHFYDGVIFHRVMPGFMIQGGDPDGTGAGGPGYRFDDEYLQGKYTRGTVAMANAGPNTNGSQFFIMHADYNLPNLYVIFGKVVSGLETVDKIAQGETTISMGGEKSKPVTPVKITSVEISEK